MKTARIKTHARNFFIDLYPNNQYYVIISVDGARLQAKTDYMANKLKFKYSKKLLSNTLTYKFSMTLNLAVTAFCVILITLYIIGNYQNFQDENQQWILTVLSYVAIFNSLFSIVLLVETAIKLFTEKHQIKNIINMIALFCSAMFCIFCTGTSNIIGYISGGIR